MRNRCNNVDLQMKAYHSIGYYAPCSWNWKYRIGEGFEAKGNAPSTWQRNFALHALDFKNIKVVCTIKFRLSLHILVSKGLLLH